MWDSLGHRWKTLLICWGLLVLPGTADGTAWVVEGRRYFKTQTSASVSAGGYRELSIAGYGEWHLHRRLALGAFLPVAYRGSDASIGQWALPDVDIFARYQIPVKRSALSLQLRAKTPFSDGLVHPLHTDRVFALAPSLNFGNGFRTAGADGYTVVSLGWYEPLLFGPEFIGDDIASGITTAFEGGIWLGPRSMWKVRWDRLDYLTRPIAPGLAVSAVGALLNFDRVGLSHISSNRARRRGFDFELAGFFARPGPAVYSASAGYWQQWD